MPWFTTQVYIGTYERSVRPWLLLTGAVSVFAAPLTWNYWKKIQNVANSYSDLWFKSRTTDYNKIFKHFVSSCMQDAVIQPKAKITRFLFNQSNNQVVGKNPSSLPGIETRRSGCDTAIQIPFSLHDVLLQKVPINVEHVTTAFRSTSERITGKLTRRYIEVTC
jgi:hypothetical protein